MTNATLKTAMASCAVFALAACGEQQAAPTETEEASVEAPAEIDIVAAALSSADRWPDDSANDERRQTAATLEFFGLAPGMSVFEVEAGGGYFTELYSLIVGGDGEVVMQNPEGFLAFVGDEITARLADDRLSNVRQSLTIFDMLDAEDETMDLVTWVQGPHELYYKPEDGTDLGDPARSYADIYRITKPGGAFAVIDHAAAAGSPETSGNELHRIDKAIVISMAEAAGFVLEAEGDFLANADDDHTKHVFDPAIRGYTDQFALRFRKPE